MTIDSPARLEVHCLSKRFHDGTLPVVNGMSFDVRPGERFALLGPSGCGKTTALRLIAGFERADHGTVSIDGRVVEGESVHVAPERRGVGVVFQDWAVFPHLTVARNVEFGLRSWRKTDARARVAEVLRLVGLTGLEDRLPHALSGGQQQRVALARALAPRPRLLLLDEPFSNLDALFRMELRDRVREALDAEGATALLVTHDQEEALSFADRVAVMQGGRIEQVGTPEEVYGQPRTLFVAQFLGQTNLLLSDAHGRDATSPLGPLRLHRDAQGTVLVSLRPEHLVLEAAPAPDAFAGRIVRRDYRGHDVTYRVQINGEGRAPVDCLVLATNREVFQVGDAVWVRALAPAVVLDRVG